MHLQELHDEPGEGQDGAYQPNQKLVPFIPSFVPAHWPLHLNFGSDAPFDEFFHLIVLVLD